jgi:hypothetical protein
MSRSPIASHARPQQDRRTTRRHVRVDGPSFPFEPRCRWSTDRASPPGLTLNDPAMTQRPRHSGALRGPAAANDSTSHRANARSSASEEGALHHVRRSRTVPASRQGTTGERDGWCDEPLTAPGTPTAGCCRRDTTIFGHWPRRPWRRRSRPGTCWRRALESGGNTRRWSP